MCKIFKNIKYIKLKKKKKDQPAKRTENSKRANPIQTKPIFENLYSFILRMVWAKTYFDSANLDKYES